ncbi:MAG: hypothetical protein ACR2IS_18680, partial [Nitrososphaeraceae archaeon]
DRNLRNSLLFPNGLHTLVYCIPPNHSQKCFEILINSSTVNCKNLQRQTCLLSPTSIKQSKTMETVVEEELLLVDKEM